MISLFYANNKSSKISKAGYRNFSFFTEKPSAAHLKKYPLHAIRPSRPFRQLFIVLLVVLPCMYAYRQSFYFIYPGQDVDVVVEVLYGIFLVFIVFVLSLPTKIDRAADGFEMVLLQRLLEKGIPPVTAKVFTEKMSRQLIEVTYNWGYNGPSPDILYTQLLIDKKLMEEFVHYLYIKCYIRLEKTPVGKGHREYQKIESLSKEYVAQFIVRKMDLWVPTYNESHYKDMGKGKWGVP
jgi:hypothetical protein